MITTLTKTSSEDNDGSAQYKKVLDLAQLGLKAVILINGVAAISLLTFVGGIMSASIIGLSVISPHFYICNGFIWFRRIIWSSCNFASLPFRKLLHAQ